MAHAETGGAESIPPVRGAEDAGGERDEALDSPW